VVAAPGHPRQNGWHEALDMKCPAEVCTPSAQPYQGIPEPHYPFHDRTVMVTDCGRLCL
jgi:hypothetical protein